MKRLYRSAVRALLLIVVSRTPLLAATLPASFAEAPVASGLASPTSMAFSPDGRLFVCLQGGQVRIIENGTLLSTPFVTLAVDPSGEHGLLGLAFDPNFETNHFVYIYYTATSPSTHNRVSRFVANGNVAAAGSETVILDLDALTAATNDNGGALRFGIDGKLYVAVGDNGTASNSQSLNNLFGKILRINPDGTIPADNPFISQTFGASQAIWAMGLRNPRTFAFHPLNGRMLINDAGQNAFDEINDGFAGSNYGWPSSEGPSADPNHRGPIYDYRRTAAGSGCGIAGGTFYSPASTQFPLAFVGTYFFADACSGWIKILDPGNDNAVTDFATGISGPVDLQIGPEGHLYYLARSAGAIFRIYYTANQAPRITLQPVSQAVAAGQPATFTVDASGTPSPSTRWQRNGVDIPGASSVHSRIASVSAADNGARFRAVATNVVGSVTSDDAILTVVSARVNVALAANGATAIGSSTYSAGYAASGAINGDRKGQPWGSGGGWNDGTAGAWPDWLEVDFAGAQTIDEVDVFSVQDNYGSPVEPTAGMTFSLYGLRDFTVQYWDGAQWATVPGGAVTGNTLVWRQMTFAPVTTAKIRVFVTNALSVWSRITEVEAYQTAAGPPPNVPPTVTLTSPAGGTSYTAPASIPFGADAHDSDGTVKRVNFYDNGTLVGSATTSPYQFTWMTSATGTHTLTAAAIDNLDAATTSTGVQVTVNPAANRTNVALAANGATAIGSSTYSGGYAASGAINGDRKGQPWGNGGGWNDGTAGAWPDWLEVDFAGSQTIDEVDVFSVQDNYGSPVEPTAGMTFSLYGLRDFTVQYWDGAQWATVPGGAVTGNTLVWRQVAFAAVTTTKIRVFVTNALSVWSRITEVEAYSGGTSDTQPPVVTNLQPIDGSIISGPVTLSATATDDVGVVGVQFQVDSVNIGSEDQAAPYGVTWDSLSVGNGMHVLTALAHDWAGNTASASATVTVSNMPPVFPLKVGADLRHMVDQNNVPFLINGDAAWSVMVGLQKPDVSVYLDDRRAKGFNTILVELIEHHFSVDPPKNAYGDAPFTTPGDFSTPNDAYFAQADWVINEAAARGMLVLLAPAYLGYGCGVEGWCQEMNANGVSKMFNYGVYLGNRYKNFKNIIWVHGGDTNANAYTGTGDIVRAVINGIKSVDGPRVHTSQCNRETSALDCYDEPWLDVNTTYSACATSAGRTLTDYNRARLMPFFYIEGTYENEGASPVCLRSQAYWSILGGSAGHVFGNNPIWPFTGPAWRQALNSPGAQSMANVGALFRSRAWQTLVPDYLHQVVTAGYGNVNNATYVAAARASDGSMAIAYVPGGGTITVDMSRLNGSATARWYDPAAGTFTSIAGSPFANTGSRNFTPPGTNAGGSVDWVLVLERVTP